MRIFALSSLIALAGLTACESTIPGDQPESTTQTVLAAPALHGTCQVRDPFTSSPDRSAPPVGDGYAKQLVQAGSIDEVTAICTDAIYQDLMHKYCAANAHFPVQWETDYSPFEDEGGTVGGCAASGCDEHNCPPTRAACVIRTAGTALPKLSDPDDGRGYVKVGVAATTMADAQKRCTAEVFSKLSFCPAPGTVKREVIVADAHGNVQHACAGIGCSRTCRVMLPPG
jgi:hypothetical protein